MTLLRLAVRNLGRHRRRTALSMGVLALGLLVLVTLRGVMTGVQGANRSMFVEGVYGALQVHRAGYFEVLDASPLVLDFEDSPELRRRVLSVQGVRALAPRIHFAGMLSLPDEGERAGPVTHLMLTAVDPVLEQQALRRRAEWASAWPRSAQEPELILDRTLAQAMGLPERTPEETPEDRWPALLAADRDEALNGVAVRLRGHLGSGLPGDRRVGLVTLGAAQELLRMPGRVTEYAVAVDDLARLDQVRAQVQAELGPGYEVLRWDTVMPMLDDINRGQDAMVLVLSLIVMLVVLLVVANALLMTVMDRVREVGTLLALGMRRRAVVGLFVAEAAVLGAVSGALGVGLGALAVRTLQATGLSLPAPGAELPAHLELRLEPGWLAAYFLLGVAGAVGAALWASRALAKLSPVEALREP